MCVSSYHLIIVLILAKAWFISVAKLFIWVIKIIVDYNLITSSLDDLYVLVWLLSFMFCLANLWAVPQSIKNRRVTDLFFWKELDPVWTFGSGSGFLNCRNRIRIFFSRGSYIHHIRHPVLDHSFLCDTNFASPWYI